MHYRHRVVDGLLDQLFQQLPAILLDGPKAVGKTTTATRRARTIHNLDMPGEKLRAEAEPGSVLQGPRPILVDEWHRVPSTWGVIKRAVDDDYTGGQFLLTGSLSGAGTHSGAGRIASIRMRPLSFAERDVSIPSVSFRALLEGSAEITGETDVDLATYSAELMRSGFPALRQLEGKALEVALDGYIERIIDAEVRELGVPVFRPAAVQAWLRSYAAATATVASWEAIRDGAASGFQGPPAKTTAIPYRDALTRLRILDELPPWLPTSNQFARLAQGSKHFLADPALALRLMNFDQESVQTAMAHGAMRFDRPLVGRLFEALATLSVRTYAEGCYARAMHFRDGQGRHEIDLIIERGDGKVLAVEVKLGETVTRNDLKQLNWLRSQIGDDLIDSVVLYSGRHAYRYEGVALIPLALLGP